MEEIVKELGQCALEGYRTRVPEKPHAREFLQLLQENRIPVAVATASNREGVLLALERLGMLPLVDYFTTCTEVGKSKEHPDIFTTCAAQFGAAPQETVVFEDSAYAIRTARALIGTPYSELDCINLRSEVEKVVAVEDAISTQGKTGDETREGLARLANLVIADYGQLIGRLTPAEDLSQGLGELLG